MGWTTEKEIYWYIEILKNNFFGASILNTIYKSSILRFATKIVQEFPYCYHFLMGSWPPYKLFPIL
jgi:hypothetical protein